MEEKMLKTWMVLVDGVLSDVGKRKVFKVAIVMGAFVLMLALSLSHVWAYSDFEWLEDDEEGVYALSDSRAVLFVGFDYGDDGTDLSLHWYDPEGHSTTACPEWESCTAATYGAGGKKYYFYIEEQSRSTGIYTVEVNQWGYSDPIFTDTFEIKGPTIYLPLVQASGQPK